MASLVPFPTPRAAGTDRSDDAPGDGLCDFLSTDPALDFGGPAASPGPRPLVPAGDWSNQDLATLYRAHRMLNLAGLSIGTDRGLSDEGEPWFLFLDGAGEVFAHVARIGGDYLLDSLAQARVLRGRSLDALVAVFAEDQRRTADGADGVVALAPARRATTLRLHPGTMFAGLIWSIYLLAEDLLVPARPLADAAMADAAEVPGLPAHPSASADAVAVPADAFPTADADAAADAAGAGPAKIARPAPDAATARDSLAAVPAALAAAALPTLLPGSVVFGLSTISLSFVFDRWTLGPDRALAVDGLSTLHLALPVLAEVDALLTALDPVWADSVAATAAAGPESANVATSPQEVLAAALASQPAAAQIVAGLAELGQEIARIDLAALAEMAQAALADGRAAQTQPVDDAGATTDGVPVLSGFAQAAQIMSLRQAKVFFEQVGDVRQIDPTALLELARTAWLSREAEEVVHDIAFDTTALAGDQPQPGAGFGLYDEAVRSFVDYLLEKSEDTRIVSLAKEVVLIDMDAFASHGEIYARSWTFEDGGVISTVGLKSDFAAFDLIA